MLPSLAAGSMKDDSKEIMGGVGGVVVRGGKWMERRRGRGVGWWYGND